MDQLAQGFSEAVQLIVSLDQEVLTIVGLSLLVSVSATLVATLIGVPLGIWIGLHTFVGKGFIRMLLSTAMGIPPVVLGLVVMLLLAKRGPFGSLGLLFTPQAMLLAQFLLVLPIVAVGALEATSVKGKPLYELMYTLGLRPLERLLKLMWELRSSIALAVLMAFGRAISEVGAVMLVGGNIKGHTRVMTTYIATQNSMGNYANAIAMAIVLLAIALMVNAMVHSLSGGIYGHQD